MTDATIAQDRLTAAREVKRGFEARGASIAEWAREHGLSPQYVYDVLAGRTVGTRGQAHKAAVLLGLKEGEIQ